jgi:hypothetical protein
MRNDSEFVEAAIRGSARSQIKICEIGDFCFALMTGFQEHGLLDQQQFKERLHGVCPKCGVRLKGEGLMLVAMAKRFGTFSFGGGSEMTKRVLQGKCANDGCRSKKIIIEWDA